MTAGATALIVLAGAGVAGVVALSGDDARTVATADAGIGDPDLGAPRLEESPEVVSRAAAAAEPLPQRHTPATPRTGQTAAAAGRRRPGQSSSAGPGWPTSGPIGPGRAPPVPPGRNPPSGRRRTGRPHRPRPRNRW